MNVVGYVRVSSQRQVDEGLGLEVQREAIQKWAKENKHDLLAIYADEGISGAKETVDRQGLGDALLAVEDSAEALVVYRLDRLARHLVIQETILERLGSFNKRVISVTEPDMDDGDPTRVLIRQVLGAISQYERSVIAARMAAGRRAKAARGGYAYGSPPFGWKAEDGELVAVTEEQRTIARMVELRSEDRSYREIVATLTSEGFRTKRGGVWHPDIVRRVLQRSQARREAEATERIRRARATELQELAAIRRGKPDEAAFLP